MNWIDSLNKAVNYMEENITKPLTCRDIANQVYLSAAHFQRTFFLLTGFTIGEYLRNRRLTLAGQELTRSETKVIDIALKYGYETPESFSKAFSRFHGITPSRAKKFGADLKSFNRLTIKIIMEGGNIMDYRILKENAFEVVVKVKSFTEETSTKGIPEFWREYMTNGWDVTVPGMLGMCRETADGGKEFEYAIGCRKEDAKEVPEGFEVWTISPHIWAVFKCVGAMPNAVQDMWKKIYSEWLPQAKYELIQDIDFENYSEGDPRKDDYVSEIWLPVKEK